MSDDDDRDSPEGGSGDEVADGAGIVAGVAGLTSTVAGLTGDSEEAKTVQEVAGAVGAAAAAVGAVVAVARAAEQGDAAGAVGGAAQGLGGAAQRLVPGQEAGAVVRGVQTAVETGGGLARGLGGRGEGGGGSHGEGGGSGGAGAGQDREVEGHVEFDLVVDGEEGEWVVEHVTISEALNLCRASDKLVIHRPVRLDLRARGAA